MGLVRRDILKLRQEDEKAYEEGYKARHEYGGSGEVFDLPDKFVRPWGNVVAKSLECRIENLGDEDKSGRHAHGDPFPSLEPKPKTEADSGCRGHGMDSGVRLFAKQSSKSI